MIAAPLGRARPYLRLAFLALALLFQSFVVQTHIHGLGGRAAAHRETPAHLVAPATGTAPADCPLCREQAMAAYYTGSAPSWEIGERINRPAMTPRQSALGFVFRRAVQARHPRGPPTLNA